MSTTTENKYYEPQGSVDELVFDRERPRNRVPTIALIRDLRRLYNELGTIPKKADVVNDGRYSKVTYEQRCPWGEWLRLTGIQTPRTVIHDALGGFYDNGNCYVTSRKLRRFMYPYADLTRNGRNFSANTNMPVEYRNDPTEYWEYPRFSAQEVGNTIAQFAEGEYDHERFTFSLWSESTPKTWRMLEHK